MKKTMSSFGLLLLASLLIASTPTDVPEKVKASFLKKFPQAEEVEWALVNEDYKATCYNEGYYTEITYKADGFWMQTTTYLDEVDLPEAILTHVENKYEAFYISESRLEETRKGKHYHLELMDEEENVKNLLFNEQGVIVQ